MATANFTLVESAESPASYLDSDIGDFLTLVPDDELALDIQESGGCYTTATELVIRLQYFKGENARLERELEDLKATLRSLAN